MLVQKELERMILAGDLAAGAKLNEASVADSLGVSRGPVREAFRALEESGLVRLEKNRGVFVRQISVAEANEIYEVRAALDEWTGRRLAQTATAEHIRELRAFVERMDRAAAKDDVQAYWLLNLDFPRSAGLARRQRQAAGDVPPAGQRIEPVPPADACRRAEHCPCRRASTARSSTRSPRATRPPPDGRSTTTSWPAANACTRARRSPRHGPRRHLAVIAPRRSR